MKKCAERFGKQVCEKTVVELFAGRMTRKAEGEKTNKQQWPNNVKRFCPEIAFPPSPDPCFREIETGN